MLSLHESGWALVVLIALYASAGAYIWNGSLKNSISSFGKILLLVPVGIILDVIFDWFVMGVERNLFPIEIILTVAIAVLSMPIGMVGMKLMHSNKSLKEVDANRSDP
jgi:hypothetical protein